jgi:hypothetical protein
MHPEDAVVGFAGKREDATAPLELGVEGARHAPAKRVLQKDVSARWILMVRAVHY